MEWIDGLRCTNPDGIRSSGVDVGEFIRCGVVSGMRQLLEVTTPPRWQPLLTLDPHLLPSPLQAAYPGFPFTPKGAHSSISLCACLLNAWHASGGAPHMCASWYCHTSRLRQPHRLALICPLCTGVLTRSAVPACMALFPAFLARAGLPPSVRNTDASCKSGPCLLF